MKVVMSIPLPSGRVVEVVMEHGDYMRPPDLRRAAKLFNEIASLSEEHSHLHRINDYRLTPGHSALLHQEYEGWK